MQLAFSVAALPALTEQRMAMGWLDEDTIYGLRRTREYRAKFSLHLPMHQF